MDFTCEILKDEKDILKIRFVGLLNEEASLPSDLNLDGKKELRIDMGRLEFINSSGIKKWLTFSENLGKRSSLKILFYRVPGIFINQMNIIQGFFPANGELVSVYIPVYCERCKETYYLLKTIYQAKYLPTEQEVLNAFDKSDCSNKQDCRGTLEVDVNLEYYLPFLKKK